MVPYVDAAGRTWPLAVTVGGIARARALAGGAELLAVVERGLAGLADVTADPVRLAAVLYALCQADACAAGVGREAFVAAVRADAIDRGTAALCDAVLAFFPEPRPESPAEATATGAGPAVTAADVERTCWELAGVLGIDPRPLTLRQLDRMHEARCRHDWGQTASLLSMLDMMRVNQLATGGVTDLPTPRSPDEFNPYARENRNDAPAVKMPVTVLRALFQKNR